MLDNVDNVREETSLYFFFQRAYSNLFHLLKTHILSNSYSKWQGCYQFGNRKYCHTNLHCCRCAQGPHVVLAWTISLSQRRRLCVAKNCCQTTWRTFDFKLQSQQTVNRLATLLAFPSAFNACYRNNRFSTILEKKQFRWEKSYDYLPHNVGIDLNSTVWKKTHGELRRESKCIWRKKSKCVIMSLSGWLTHVLTECFNTRAYSGGNVVTETALLRPG